MGLTPFDENDMDSDENEQVNIERFDDIDIDSGGKGKL